MCNARIHDSQHRFGVDLTSPGFNITPLGVNKHIITLLGVTFFFLFYFNTDWCSSKKPAPARCETVFQSKVTPESHTKRLQLYTIGVKLPENFLECMMCFAKRLYDVKSHELIKYKINFELRVRRTYGSLPLLS